MHVHACYNSINTLTFKTSSDPQSQTNPKPQTNPKTLHNTYHTIERNIYRGIG